MNQPSPIIVEEQGNLILGVLAGAAGALVGAAAWAAITVATGYQIGWMAVGVGFLVGIAVRFGGRGSSILYGIVGAVLALAGCLAGNVLALVGFVASAESIPFMSVLAQTSLPLAVSAIVDNGSPIDLLFYGIAVYEGFKLSTVPAAPVATGEGDTSGGSGS